MTDPAPPPPPPPLPTSPVFTPAAAPLTKATELTGGTRPLNEETPRTQLALVLMDSFNERNKRESGVPSVASSAAGDDSSIQSSLQRQVAFTPETVDNELTAKKYAKDAGVGISQTFDEVGSNSDSVSQMEDIYPASSAASTGICTVAEPRLTRDDASITQYGIRNDDGNSQLDSSSYIVTTEPSDTTDQGLAYSATYASGSAPAPEGGSTYHAAPPGSHIQTITLSDDRPASAIKSVDEPDASKSFTVYSSSSLTQTPQPTFTSTSDNAHIETVQFYVDQQGHERRFQTFSPDSALALVMQSSTGYATLPPSSGTIQGFSAYKPAGYSSGSYSTTPGPHVTKAQYGTSNGVSNPKPYIPAEVHSGPTSTVIIGAGLSNTNIPLHPRPISTPVSVNTNGVKTETFEPRPATNMGTSNGYGRSTLITIGNPEPPKPIQTQAIVPPAIHQNGFYLAEDFSWQREKRRICIWESHCKIITGIICFLVVLAIGIGIAVFITYKNKQIK